MAVAVKLLVEDSLTVSLDFTIAPPAAEVVTYEEPALFSPVKRNAVRITLASPEAKATPSEVREMFSFAGEIESFEVHEKGASLITFSDEQAADTALLLNDAALLGSPVSVAAVIMERNPGNPAAAETEADELPTPPSFYAQCEHAEEQKRALLADGARAEAAARALQSMVQAGYSLGARALEFVAEVDERHQMGLREGAAQLADAASEHATALGAVASEKASALGAAASEMLRSGAEQISSLDAEGAGQLSSQVLSKAKQAAAVARSSLEEKSSEVASQAKAVAAHTQAVASQTYAHGSEVASGVASKAGPALATGVEKGRVLAHIALSKAQRLLFSCPSPVKSPPPQAAVYGSAELGLSGLSNPVPLNLAPGEIVEAEISADLLSPTYSHN